MMDRRAFLRGASLIAAGVAVDQLELVERLGWTRRFFPGWRADEWSVTADGWPGPYAGNTVYVTVSGHDAMGVVIREQRDIRLRLRQASGLGEFTWTRPLVPVDPVNAPGMYRIDLPDGVLR